MAPADVTDVNESFRIVMRLIADLSLEVRTCRVFLRAEGVTDEEFAAARDELARCDEAEKEAPLERIHALRAEEKLRKILDRTKQ